MARKVNKVATTTTKTKSEKPKISKTKIKPDSNSNSNSNSNFNSNSNSNFNSNSNSNSRSKSAECNERTSRKAMTKKHKQKLLDAKLARQRERNHQITHLRRKMDRQRRQNQRDQKPDENGKEKPKKLEATLDKSVAMMRERLNVDGFWMKFTLFLEDFVSNVIYFLTVTMRSERTFDWLVFLANNLGLYQQYEINNYGQRLSPRTGRPVLLSLGPFRVVQVVESANQVRSHWDPYIREYLKNSKLTTDCWRANRMALQVALCMDDSGQMFDMPIEESLFQSKN